MFLKDGASEAGSGTESELANLDEDTKEALETNMVSYLFVTFMSGRAFLVCSVRATLS